MNGSSVPQATLWTAERIIAALRASWILLVLLAFLALVLGALAWRSVTIRMTEPKPGRPFAPVASRWRSQA